MSAENIGAPFVPSWLDDANLSLKAFRVLAHLWRRRNARTMQCNPCVAAIAETCRLNRGTVWQAILELERANLLTRGKCGFRASNSYVLNVPSTGRNFRPVESLQLDGNLDTNRTEIPATKGPLLKDLRQREPAKPATRAHFSAPSHADWMAYASEISWPHTDAIGAFDHYTAVGWRIGNKPMRDWKAAARNCQRRGNSRHGSPATLEPVRLGSNLR